MLLTHPSIHRTENCQFAPGLWICSGTLNTAAPGCLFWDEEWVIEDFSEDASGSLLSITYKFLPACKCICGGELYCDGPCHPFDCVWTATCSNGQINGSFFRGNRESCPLLTGLINQHSILFKFGDNISQGTK